MITVQFEIEERLAMTLEQFCKHLRWSAIRENTADLGEARDIVQALELITRGMEEAGYAPNAIDDPRSSDHKRCRSYDRYARAVDVVDTFHKRYRPLNNDDDLKPHGPVGAHNRSGVMRCNCGSYAINIERGMPNSLCDVCHYKAQVEAHRETVAQWILSLGMSTGHGDTIDDLLLECGAQIKELGSVRAWINVDERMPEAGRKVLAAYRNCLGKYRRICAEYVAKHSRSADDLNDEMDMDYCEEKDEYYWPDGWYECIENWGDFSHLRVSDHVTHWMPLPPAPEGK